ncbi:MAG TPA: helicase, partial [Armatimonadota bacterium]|nr:helicase [Armatimonadota bacterium]
MSQLASKALSHVEVRDEFHNMVRRELLGPCQGREEELDEKVSWRYLVGWLAPRNTTPARDDVDDGPLDTPGEEDTGEEGIADDPLLRSASMLPNSFGFTFCVAAGVQRLRVRAEWGWYRRRPSETGFQTPTGAPKMVWYRTPVERETVLELEPGELTPWSPETEAPAAQVTGTVFDRGDGTRLVTLFLVNGQESAPGKEDRWLFQASLRAESVDGSPCFAVRTPQVLNRALDPADQQASEETRMAYRDEVEFAVGHGTAVDWTVGETPGCATAVWTTAMPAHEVPRSRPAQIPGLETRMAALAAAGQADLRGLLAPLVTEYWSWIEQQHARLARGEDRLLDHEEPARRVLQRASLAAERVEAGIDLLSTDAVAFDAFRFMNGAMHLQRLHTLLSQRVRRGEKVDLAQIEAEETPRWYPFQLAFILLNLPSLTQLDHPERSGPNGPGEADSTAELLWFPTGGGKTEAYLGLTAYTLALRRLQPEIEGRPGAEGVGVLMRYTLRLLTLQQFQRAATLICACEVLRRREPGTWGETPFRIGLWLGRASTPNTFEQAQALLEPQEGGYGGGVGAAGTLHQLTNCPWCGQVIRPRDDLKADPDRRRILTYCGDPMGRCDFSSARSPGEGLPVCIVDEDVYRLLPGLVIATVDKFAQMPWNGEVQLLAGKVA